MANPKYEFLPGIAHDQPDIYETNDLPEAEQGNLSMSDVIMEQCDSVEIVKVCPDDAFKKFQGTTLDGKYVDFTDRIGRTSKTGYHTISGVWEIAGNRQEEPETPLQTYNRLQFETKQLFEKVTEIKEASKECPEIPPVVLAHKIEEIQKELQDLHMEKVLGSEVLSEITDPTGAVYNKLLTQLDHFKKTPVQEKKPVATSPSSDIVKYELFIKPDQAKLEEASRVASLEQRLRNLENVIGHDKKKLSFLTSNTDGKNLRAAVGVLSSKLNLLEPGYLDQVESRLVLLHQAMLQVADKKQLLQELHKQNKVAELYDLSRKVDQLSLSLPHVVQRLLALKDLHDQALQFSKALTHLDTMQQQISSALHSNHTLLKDVQLAFSKNSQLIQNNITSLNSRITHLNQ